MPNAANRYIKSEEGEFDKDGHLREGKITYLPNAENGYKESEEGRFGPDGRLTKGKKRYSKRLLKNFFRKTRKVSEKSIQPSNDGLVLQDNRPGSTGESVL